MTTSPPRAAAGSRPPGVARPARDSWFRLDFFTRPPAWGSAMSAFVIVSLLAATGLVDYLTGPNLSLRVFYDIPVALAVVWIGGWAGVVACVGCVGMLHFAAWMEDAPYARPPQVWWNIPFGFVSYLLVAWILHVLVHLRRDLEQRVRQRTAALERESQARAELQRELLLASGRERSAIGQDLHDGLCQHLVGTALAAQVLAGRLGARQAAEHDEAGQVVRLIEEGIAQTRHLARGLLLASIKPERLVPELEELAVNVSRQSGVPCRFLALGTPAAPDEQTASHLFRIAEEAVRNSLRHARPRSVEITLAAAENGLTLTVTDRGEGLPPVKSGAGVGLRIMGHRARVIGGDLTVEHQPGRGTAIRCHLPAA